jgi:hypothetical protein
LSLYLTKPTHSQRSYASYDFANLFGREFWQIHRGLHFEANGENATTELDKEAPAGGWGALGLGLLDFRDIPHPSIIAITTGLRIWFQQSPICRGTLGSSAMAAAEAW